MEFPFETGPFDHGSEAGVIPSSTGGDTLGKTIVLTIGGDNTPLTVVAITEIAPVIGELETTKHDDSTWREFCAALKSHGAMKITVHHEPDSQLEHRLLTLKETRNTETFRIWFPGISKFWIEFEAFVANVRYETPIGGIVQGAFALTPSNGIRRYDL